MDRILETAAVPMQPGELSLFFKELQQTEVSDKKSQRIYSLSERQTLMERYADSNKAVAQKFFAGEQLFAPLPEKEEGEPYPSLEVDEAFRLLSRMLFYCIRSNAQLHRLKVYIEQNKLFDEKWYREQYLLGREELYSPLDHFVRFGMFKGYAPNPIFDTEKCWRACPGLRASGIPPFLVSLVLQAMKEV